MKYITISILSVLVFSAIASAQNTTIEMQPPEINVESGQTFNVSLYVTANQVINTVATDLITYDKDVLECISVQQGTLFPDTVIWIASKIDNTKGTLENMVWGSQLTTNSSGTFAILTFKAKSGTTNIVIDEQNYGVANDGIAVNRTVLNSCKVTVAGGGSIIPTNITLPPILMPFILIVIVIIVATVLIIIFLRKRKSKPKKQDDGQKKTEDDDVFG